MSDRRYNINYTWTQQYSLNPEYKNFEFTVSNWVYHNESMMQSIEKELADMYRFPDAERILSTIINTKNNS